MTSPHDAMGEVPDGPAPTEEDSMGTHCHREVWADDPAPAGKGGWRRKYVDPSTTSREGVLLARLRRQPGRWLRVATNRSPWWWFTRDAKPANDLLSRRLVVKRTEVVSAFGQDVWLRALTPDEMDTEREIEATT